MGYKNIGSIHKNINIQNGYEMLYIVKTHIHVYYLNGFGVSGVFQREKLAKNSLKLSKISPKTFPVLLMFKSLFLIFFARSRI